MASDFRKSDFVYGSRTWTPTERATPTSGCSREGVPPIKIAEIPRPLWHHPLIDWDDDDPPPLPARFEPEVAPRPRYQPRVAIIIALVIGLVAAGSGVGLSRLPWAIPSEIADGHTAASGAQTEDIALSSRIDTAIAVLPREELNASEQRRALIRSIQPELMSPEVDGPASDR
jgi:hypothetical protein